MAKVIGLAACLFLFAIQSVLSTCPGVQNDLWSFPGDILFQPCTTDTQNMQNIAFTEAGNQPNAILVPSCPEGLICNNWCVPADLSQFGLRADDNGSCGNSRLAMYTDPFASSVFNGFCFLANGEFCHNHFECNEYNCINNICQPM